MSDQPTHLTVLPSPSAAVVNPDNVAADFSLARQYHQNVGAGLVSAAVSMIFSGHELNRLFKKYGIKRGGDRRSEEANRQSGGLKWEDILAHRSLAKKAKDRIPTLQALDLSNRPINDLPADQLQEVIQAVHEVCDGSTAQELMAEWGIVKQAKRLGGGDGRPPGPTEEEPMDVQAQNNIWPVLETLGSLRLNRTRFETYLNHLPLVADAPQDGEAPKASLALLEEELEGCLNAVGQAIKHRKKTEREATKAKPVPVLATVEGGEEDDDDPLG